MPNTISSYVSFVSGTKAKAEEINSNFSNHRGDLLPIKENSVGAQDDAYSLGNGDYRWNSAYFRTWQFKSTSTYAALSNAYQDTAGNLVFNLPSTKEYQFKINSIDYFKMTDSGTSSQFIKTRFASETGGSVVMTGATTTFSGFTVPCTLDYTGSTYMATINPDTSFSQHYVRTQNGRFQMDLMTESGTVGSTFFGQNTTTSGEVYQPPGFSITKKFVNTISANFYLQFTKITGTAWSFAFRGNLKIQELI